MEQISFTVDNQKLVGTLLYPKKIKTKNPAILLIHGWMTSQKRNIMTAEELVKLGFVCLTFDLGSHGDSEGSRKVLSRTDYLQDCIAAYDFLKQQKNVDAKKIGLIGSSFGSYLGCLLSVEREFAWLILRVPANYQDQGFDLPQVKIAGKKSVEWRKKACAFNENKALHAIHQYTHDILIIESENDDLVPRQTIVNYIHAVNNPSQLTHKIMRDADHSMTKEKYYQAYLQILVNWLQQYSSSD